MRNHSAGERSASKAECGKGRTSQIITWMTCRSDITGAPHSLAKPQRICNNPPSPQPEIIFKSIRAARSDGDGATVIETAAAAAPRPPAATVAVASTCAAQLTASLPWRQA